MFCASIVYPAGLPWFDKDYFGNSHLPMFAELLGENCVHWEVHFGLDTPGAPALPFIAAGYVWVQSAPGFGQTIQTHSEALYADIANFSPAQPTRGWAQVAARRPGEWPSA